MKSLMKNKKAIAPLILGVLIVGMVIAISYGAINLGTITGASSGYIERPVFYYIKCEAVGGIKYTPKYDISSAGAWVNKPSIGSSYSVAISINKVPLVGNAERIKYSVCNSKVVDKSNCRLFERTEITTAKYGGKLFTIANVAPDENVFVRYEGQYIPFGGWRGLSDAQYEIGFVPYGLRAYNVLAGSSKQLNPNDCTLNSPDYKASYQYYGTNSQKLSSDLGDSSAQSYKTSPTFAAEEVRWYVAGYVTSKAESFVLQYKGQSAWCRQTGTSAEIYKINSLTTKGGIYYIASADYSDLLGTVACCPGQINGDSVCSSDFKYISVKGSECGAFKSCGSAEWSPSTKAGTLIRYYCDSGVCKQKTKTVECTRDEDCLDRNKVCDLNSYTCENANVNLDGENKIEAIPDNSADCEKKGGRWITKNTEEKTLWNYIGLGSPKVVTTEYCDLGGAGIPWATIFVIILLIAGVMIFIRYRTFIRGWIRL